jgi:hypothetical protein
VGRHPDHLVRDPQEDALRSLQESGAGARRRSIKIFAVLVTALTALVAPSPAGAVPPTPGAQLTIDLNDGLTFAHCKFEIRSVDLDADTAEVMFTTSFRPTGPYNYARNRLVRFYCLLSDQSAGVFRGNDLDGNPLYGTSPIVYAPAYSQVFTIPLRDNYEICATVETYPQYRSPENRHHAEACGS